MRKARAHRFDQCSLEELNIGEIQKYPDYVSGFLYERPLQDIQIHQSKYYPDCNWPEPYEGVFDHVKDGVEWLASQDEAFFFSDLYSDNDCTKMYSKPQMEYINFCYNIGIIPNNNFLKHLQDKRIKLHSIGIDCDEIQAICKLLSENLTVKSLDVADNQIKNVGAHNLANLLQENDLITELNVSYNGLGDEGCCKVMESVVKTSFNLLDISGNNITDKSLPVIASVIKDKAKIKSLILSHNNLGWYPIHPEKSFQVALANNWSLQKLDLSWNNFNGNQATYMIMGLKDNQSIIWVDLSHNGITDRECPALLKCLTSNKTLQYMDISYNFITSAGAKILAKGIKTNDSLMTFKIGRNHIGDAGALALLVAYSANDKSALQTLDFEKICVSPSFVALKDQLSGHQITIKHGNLIRDDLFKDQPWSKVLEKFDPKK